MSRLKEMMEAREDVSDEWGLTVSLLISVILACNVYSVYRLRIINVEIIFLLKHNFVNLHVTKS